MENRARLALDAFQSKLRLVGIDVSNYTHRLRVNFNPANVEAEINAAIHRFVGHPERPPPKLILVIIPYLDSSIYNGVKFACDVKEGLLNVCTLGPKFAKAND
jgi:eukaryotic translation initiation factor 2C